MTKFDHPLDLFVVMPMFRAITAFQNADPGYFTHHPGIPESSSGYTNSG